MSWPNAGELLHPDGFPRATPCLIDTRRIFAATYSGRRAVRPGWMNARREGIPRLVESTEIHEAPNAGGRLVSMLARPDVWLGLLAVLLAGWAYRDLLGLGTRFGFALGVEYWLFQPSDSAPLIILLISGWLLYRRSNRFATLSVSSGQPWLALPCYAACFLFYGWSVYTGSLDMRVFSFVAFLFGSIALFYGRPGLHALWLPAAFVLFAIKIPAPLMLEVLYHLQMWTAEYAGWLLYTIGETAFVSGDQIIRASQRFQVVEGCSGMRSLETLTMLTVLMADLFGRRGWHAFFLLLSAPIVAFALNGVRVLTIILNPHSDISTIHNAQGIAVLMVGLLIIYGFDELLERMLPARANPAWRPLPNGVESQPRNRLAVMVGCCAVSLGLLLLGARRPGVARARLADVEPLRGARASALGVARREAPTRFQLRRQCSLRSVLPLRLRAAGRSRRRVRRDQ